MQFLVLYICSKKSFRDQVEVCTRYLGLQNQTPGQKKKHQHCYVSKVRTMYTIIYLKLVYLPLTPLLLKFDWNHIECNITLQISRFFMK